MNNSTRSLAWRINESVMHLQEGEQQAEINKSKEQTNF
jgi:hypothetical protein